MKMRWHDLPSPLVVILGATAVGKTEISIRLAEHFGAEIVSADSRLFYRGMDIGTAKPTPEELAQVPHHLIDVTTPDHPWSLAVYKKAAELAIDGIHAREKLPFLVGGTGQYIQAVLEDWSIPAQQPDPRMRQALNHWAQSIGADELHRKLSILDPVAAMTIQSSNLRRTIRALEVLFGTGRRFSDQRRRKGSRFSLLKIGLRRPRVELYRRIDERIQQMIQAGLIEEVRALLEKGYDRHLPAMSAIGYREIIAYLNDEMTLDQAIAQIKKLTRIFVRRQANWFKESDATIHWFSVGDATLDQIIQLLESGQGWIESTHRAG